MEPIRVEHSTIITRMMINIGQQGYKYVLETHCIFCSTGDGLVGGQKLVVAVVVDPLIDAD